MFSNKQQKGIVKYEQIAQKARDTLQSSNDQRIFKKQNQISSKIEKDIKHLLRLTKKKNDADVGRQH